MEESRQKLFVQLFAIATVVSLSLILTVYIASTYYKDVSDLSYWTPVPSDTPTSTPVPPTQLAPPPTKSPTPTEEPIIAQNCTYSALYWFYHPEAWPPQIVVGSLTYSKDEALIILQSPNPDQAARLFTQLHGAILNYLAGADFESTRQTAIEASTWLANHPAGAEMSAEDQQLALALEKALADYNSGLAGPGRCPDEPVPPAMTPTDTPSPEFTSTLSATNTVAPAPPNQVEPTSPPRRKKDPTQQPQPTSAPPKPPTSTPKPPPPPPTPVPTRVP